MIIARYNENLEWTKQFNDILIYNKGNKLDIEHTIIPLNNVGREGHTYYKHIFDNYDNLDDYTIFLQGNPFDHSPNIIKNINTIKQMYTMNNGKLDFDFKFLSERILTCNLINCIHHSGLNLKEVYEKLFNQYNGNITYEFGAGAQFIVSKQQILKRPKEFYLNIVKLLEYHINPIEGFVIERFHKLILDC